MTFFSLYLDIFYKRHILYLIDLNIRILLNQDQITASELSEYSV